MKLKDIQAPIATELALFEERFREAMHSPVPLLNRITRYVLKQKGKQMRPMFVFLSAGLCGGINDSTYRGASLVELLHTASLVHDDVVDNANERRGFFSVNALWKNKAAVLIGDFLLSRGMSLSVRHNELALLKVMSDAVGEMSEGELLQIEKARKLDIEEPVYFEIIRKKTASLIAACCASGASSAGASPETVEKMRLFGEKVGIAFQIKDDLCMTRLQTVSAAESGSGAESTGPLIHCLKNASRSEKRRIINLVKNHSEEKAKVAEVIAFVRQGGGLAYAEQKMMQYQRDAFDMLRDFPENTYRTALEQLVRFTTERKK